jgi:hypothetical protein
MLMYRNAEFTTELNEYFRHTKEQTCFYVESLLESRAARFILVHHNKTAKSIPKQGKLFQMAIKYTNVFHCKTLQNLPKLVFFGLKIYLPSGNPVGKNLPA